MSARIPVGILGYRGYSGQELVAILSRHRFAQPILIEHREAEDRPRPVNHPGPRRIPLSAENVRAEGLAAVFLATPADVSMELAPALLGAGAKVIDLSAAFRLRSPEEYQRWYKEPHTQPDLLKEAVYGLPEFCRQRIPGARLIANPGCYPTAANLALRPLLEAGVVDRSAGIVCDAKSGVSGAGRRPTLKNSFSEVTENFGTYAILEHRHVPEILAVSGLDEGELSFTAQLIPIDRGILETIYFRASGVASAADLVAIFASRYAREPLVRWYEPGQVPDVKSISRTNFCDLGVRYDPASRRTVVVAAVDNLLKGAAGQAIQNMNLALGFPEIEGLL
jgi:N-acetyl-gamma-glutamyl-phosphate reductase